MLEPSSIACVVGRAALGALAWLGAATLVTSRIARCLPRLRTRELIRRASQFGYDSLPLALVVSTLAGATVVLQTSLYVDRFGARSIVGWAAGYAILWEFGPLLLGLLMAARIGARNAAELALLRLGGQLEGLTAISLDPYAVVVAPAALAAAGSVAALATLVFVVAIGWEAIAAAALLKLPVRDFFESFSSSIRIRELAVGLAKSCSYGAGIGLVSTLEGLRAEGGARGVGRAAAMAVVRCCAAIFALDFVLTSIFARLVR